MSPLLPLRVPKQSPDGTMESLECIADVVILTILPEENRAVFEALQQHGKESMVQAKQNWPNRYSWHTFPVSSPHGPLRVAVGVTGRAGNDNMQAAVTDGLQHFHPTALLIVGVAGGLPKDNDPMHAGDIVIGDAIWSVDRGKITGAGTASRPVCQLGGQGMLSGMQNSWQFGDWHAGLFNANDQPPQIITGGIAASNYVITVQDHELMRTIQETTGNTVRAVEMESWGAAVSVDHYATSSSRNVMLGMVRGLSDIVHTAPPSSGTNGTVQDPSQANSNERNQWKQKAANNAARFVVTWLIHAWTHAPRSMLSQRVIGLPDTQGEPATPSTPSQAQPTPRPPQPDIASMNSTAIPVIPRDRALAELKEQIKAALSQQDARPLKDQLCAVLNLDPHSSDAGRIIDAFHALPNLLDHLLKLETAINHINVEIPQGRSGEPHPIELAAVGLFMRAAIRHVNLEAAKGCVSSEALTIVPEKCEVFISILAAALHGELRKFSLDASRPDAIVRGDGLLDLEDMAISPLKSTQAVVDEVATILKVYEFLPGHKVRDRDIRDAVDDGRVRGKNYRFIANREKVLWLHDDANCKELHQRLDIAITLAVPGVTEDADVNILSIGSPRFNRLFGDFLRKIKSKITEPPSSPDAVREAVKILLALLNENPALKAKVEPQVKKLEGSQTNPDRVAIGEVLDVVTDVVTKGGNAFDACSGLWGKVRDATLYLLTLLP